MTSMGKEQLEAFNQIVAAVASIREALDTLGMVVPGKPEPLELVVSRRLHDLIAGMNINRYYSPEPIQDIKFIMGIPVSIK